MMIGSDADLVGVVAVMMHIHINYNIKKYSSGKFAQCHAKPYMVYSSL